MSAVLQPFPLFRLLAGAVCISFSPVFIKIAAVDPDLAGFYRMLFAAGGLVVLLAIRRERPILDKRALVLLAGCGLFLSLDFMFWHRSIVLIGPGLSTLLGNFQVFFTALFSWFFFKEKINRWFALAVVLGLGGLFLITGIDISALDGGMRLGLFYGLFTALFYSLYILTIKEAVTKSAMSGAAAMLAIAVYCVLFLGGVGQFKGLSFAISDPIALLALAGVGILGSTIGWSLLSSALKVVPASIAGLVMLLQPALSFIWDILLFQRPTGLLEYLGVVLILTAIYLGTLRGPA